MKLLTKNFAFIDTREHCGAFNMEWDVQRAFELRAQSALPSVRVYGWNPWCISLGRNQSIDDIQLEKAYQRGIDIIHRPTGGRAILHAQEVTYSVIMPSEGKGILDVYKHVANALVTGLQYLVPGLSLSKSEPDFQKLYKEPGSIPCFSSSARYEIEYRGKKVVGSAQRRFSSTSSEEIDVVLQHGSILIDRAHLRLVDYLAINERTRDALRHDLEQHTTTLNDILQRDVAYDDIADCIRRGFEEEWNIEFDDSFSPQEKYFTYEAIE